MSPVSYGLLLKKIVSAQFKPAVSGQNTLPVQTGQIQPTLQCHSKTMQIHTSLKS